ncbi:MAG: hypothetical protein EZS28_024239, partial [Streblomastix strix]
MLRVAFLSLLVLSGLYAQETELLQPNQDTDLAQRNIQYSSNDNLFLSSNQKFVKKKIPSQRNANAISGTYSNQILTGGAASSPPTETDTGYQWTGGGALTISNCIFQQIILSAESLLDLKPTVTADTVKITDCVFQGITVTADVVTEAETAFKSTTTIYPTLGSTGQVVPILIQFNTDGAYTYTVSIERTRFISTHGTCAGAVAIFQSGTAGGTSSGTVTFTQCLFCRTVAEFGAQYIQGTTYGNAVYYGDVDLKPTISTANYIQSYTDCDSPSVALEAMEDITEYDYLMKMFPTAVVINITGGDSNPGTTVLPMKTLFGALWLCTPKKADYVDSSLDHGLVPVTITFGAGNYTESKTSYIFLERLTISGAGTQDASITTVQNNKDANPYSYLIISIAEDNYECVLTIEKIKFLLLQITGPQDSVAPLINLPQGEIQISQCVFITNDTAVSHKQPFILAQATPLQLNPFPSGTSTTYDPSSEVKFINTNFANATFTDVFSVSVTGGASATLTNCTFNNINAEATTASTTSAGALGVDLSTQDVQLSGCTFSSCECTGSGHSSACVIQAPTSGDSSIDSLLSRLQIAPVITFTNCTFSNNQGQGAGAVEFYDRWSLQFAFVSCSFITNTASGSAKDVFVDLKLSSDVSQDPNPVDIELIKKAFGGCTSTSGDTGKIIGTGNPASGSAGFLNLDEVLPSTLAAASSSTVKTALLEGESNITFFFLNVTAAMTNANDGPDRPRLISINDGNYVEPLGIVVGARGFDVEGQGADRASITNSGDAGLIWWLFLVTGGSLQLQGLKLQQSFTTSPYGAFIFLRGDGALIMNSIQIVHTDQTHAQKSGTIEATAGSVSFEN